MLLFAIIREFGWAITFGSVGIAFISVNLGLRSKKIAVDSANATFLSVLSDVEDKRIDN